jgi:hypothetical protein
MTVGFVGHGDRNRQTLVVCRIQTTDKPYPLSSADGFLREIPCTTD